MSVTLATTPHSNWQQLAPLWNALGCAPSDDANPEGWYVGKHQLPEGHLLLAYNSPQQALVNAMEAGIQPSLALQKWQSDAQVLLNIAKRERKRSILINLDTVGENRQLVVDAVARNWKQAVLDVTHSGTEQSNDTNLQYLILAALTVIKAPTAKALMAKLDASSLKLPSLKHTCPVQENVDSLFAGLISQPENKESRTPSGEMEKLKAEHAEGQLDWKRKEAALVAVQEENTLLLNQLHLIQEELEQSIIACNAAEQLSNTAEAIQHKLQQENRMLIEAKATLSQEYAQLKETSDKRAKSHAVKIARLESQLEKQVEKTDEAEKVFSEAAKHHQEKQLSMGEENQLLLEQLHLVQGDLEKNILANNESEQTSKATQHKLQQENQVLARTIATQVEQLEGLQALIKKEQTLHAKIHAEKGTLENQLTVLKAANKAQAKRAEELEAQLTEQVENTEQAEKARAAAELRYQQAVILNKQVANQYAASKKESRLLQQRLYKLRDSIENLERSNKTLNGNLAEVKIQFASEKKHNEDWECKFQKSEKESALALAYANRRIAVLSAELNKITKSRSWRLANVARSYKKSSENVISDQLEIQKKQLHESGLFDENWYLETYPDVATTKLSPIEHYLEIGAYEGRNPCENFDTTWYLTNYRDVIESGLNPLIHYICYGKYEHRVPRPGALVALPAPQGWKETENF